MCFQGSPFVVGDSVQHECKHGMRQMPYPLPHAQCFHPEAWLALDEQERFDLARGYQRSAGYLPAERNSARHLPRDHRDPKLLLEILQLK
jgi:hypothetical protein